MTNARRSGAEEGGIERKDDVGLLDGVLRVYVLAKGELTARSRVMTAGRLPLNPLRPREARQELAYLRTERRRGNGFRQYPDAGALAGFLRLEGILEGRRKRAEGTDVAEVGDVSRSIRVVETEDRGLGKQVRGTAARWMIGVPFDFRGAPLVALDQQPDARTVHRHRGRKKERLAGDLFFRLAHVGNDFLVRLPRAGADACQRQRCTHQLQEAASADGIKPLGGVLRKLSMEKLLEFRRLGK